MVLIMSKPVPSIINKRNRVKHEKWKNGDVAVNIFRTPKALHAAKIANEAIDYARFRSRLVDGVIR